ncbi:MAG: efflux RND transporter periplasmic adaptor subunit [Phycisphaerales bacterium]|nr:efflux RND transporter periplasmic adaptor subunit [Planctomycetota bacterium]
MNKSAVLSGVGLLAGLLLVGGGIAAWKYRQIRAAAAQTMPQLPQFVEFVKAEKIPWQPRSRLVGTVIGKRSVNLANEIAGTVVEVGFDSGETVQPGQMLLRLDTSTEQADLEAARATERLAQSGVAVAEAETRVAKSNLDLAQNNLRRYKSAISSSSVAEADVDRAQSEVDKGVATLERSNSMLGRAKAEREQASAKVKQLETLIAKKTLHAPFLARAGMRMIHPGQYLSEGTNVVGLTELTDDIYIDFAVPQEYAQRVQAGTVVTAKSEMLGSDEAKITVVSIDATANPTTRNVRVRSSVPNPGYKLKPGMFIDVEVPVAPVEQVIALPATAVRRAAYGDNVYLLTPEQSQMPGTMKAHQKFVKLGANLGDKVVVESGLSEGDVVASSGSAKLWEGALVAQSPPQTGGTGNGASEKPAEAAAGK